VRVPVPLSPRSFVALFVVLALGCAPLRPSVPSSIPLGAVAIRPEETDDCARPSQRFGESGEGQEPAVDDPALVAELATLPPDLRRTARAIGLEQQLATLLRAHREHPDERSVELVATRLQVVMRISAVEIELGSLLFEADCTGDQLEAALLELERRRSPWEPRRGSRPA